MHENILVWSIDIYIIRLLAQSKKSGRFWREVGDVPPKSRRACTMGADIMGSGWKAVLK